MLWIRHDGGNCVERFGDPVATIARRPEDRRRIGKGGGVGALHILPDAAIGIDVEIEHKVGRYVRGHAARHGGKGVSGHGVLLSEKS